MTRVEQALKNKGISIETLAKILGIHRNSASNKVCGKTQFTITEAYMVKKSLLPEYDWEYLFVPEPQPPTH